MSKLSVVFGGTTQAGVKAENQDAFAAHLPTGTLLEHKGAVACLADGLSTSPQAKLASRTCTSTFVTDYLATPETWSVERSAAKILRSLNAWCYAQGTSQVPHGVKASKSVNENTASGSMLTTLSAIVFKGQAGHVFHVGDSRIYRLQDGALEQITRDHKQQQANQSFLTRAIGADSHVEVDYHKVSLSVNDVFVLTSDGVHDFISHKALLKSLKVSDSSLEEKSASIIQQALSNGSDDNLSCLLVQIDALDDANIHESFERAAQLAIPPVLEVGNVLEGYKVQEVLFSGTRSNVYKVASINSGEVYALKAPSSNFADDIVYLRGFAQEQWIGQRINHKHVMKILPRADNSQFLYHVCEYIDGYTLRQWMVDNPLPSLEQVRQILKPVISALRCMQRLDMVHRDLKPENIMIKRNGDVTLVDFGTISTSSITEMNSNSHNAPSLAEEVVGSVNYVAPEYLLNNQADHVSDIFSLGVITYEMLTGKLPFKPSLYKDFRPKSIAYWEYIPLNRTQCEMPLWVDMTLQKVTEPYPTRRYQALSEFFSDLEKPSETHLKSVNNAPLLKRNPVLFWKLLATTLLAINLVQLFFNAT